MPLDLDKFLKYHMRNHASYGNKNLKYSTREVRELCALAKKTLAAGSSLARINPPCIVVGDIHGQYNDLLRLFSMLKANDQHLTEVTRLNNGSLNHKMIFLGDYVDRGRHSMECICLVLALKCKFPDKYQLLRGNHECKPTNRDYGFWDELNDRYGEAEAEELWEEFNSVFAYMPLAGLVGGKILCMHGGISPELQSLRDIENIPRPLDDPTTNLLAQDLLWADPMQNITGFKDNTVRGTSVFFGEDTVIELCKRLQVDMIVRAHQMMLTGFGFFAGRHLITIFSAPRYQADNPNLGAVLIVDQRGHIGFVTMRPPATEIDEPADNSSSGSCFAGKEQEGTAKMAKKRALQLQQRQQQQKKTLSKSISKK